jgi:hypothetical protein
MRVNPMEQPYIEPARVRLVISVLSSVGDECPLDTDNSSLLLANESI